MPILRNRPARHALSATLLAALLCLAAGQARGLPIAAVLDANDLAALDGAAPATTVSTGAPSGLQSGENLLR